MKIGSLLRSFALSAYSELLRRSATDFLFPRKPKFSNVRRFHQATLTLSPQSRGEGTTGEPGFAGGCGSPKNRIESKNGIALWEFVVIIKIGSRFARY
jgi:hypothetical protein